MTVTLANTSRRNPRFDLGYDFTIKHKDRLILTDTLDYDNNRPVNIHVELNAYMRVGKLLTVLVFFFWCVVFKIIVKTCLQSRTILTFYFIIIKLCLETFLEMSKPVFDQTTVTNVFFQQQIAY